MTKRVLTPLALSAAIALAGANVASAQETDGPLVLMPISKKVVFSPGAKLTTVNDEVATLVGGQAGLLVEDTVLVGGGLYWLADPRDDVRMIYGGLVLGWRAYAGDRTSVTLRGLLGAGEATLYEGLPEYRGLQFAGSRRQPFVPGFKEDFVVAEPEIVVEFGVTDAVRLTTAAGYRLTGGNDNPAGFDELVRGATGTISVQFDMGR